MLRRQKPITDEVRDEHARINRLQRMEEFRGVLKIPMPKVKNAKLRAKWFGMPPTELGTEKKFRTGGPIAF
jgi:hypothetical protein